MRIFFLIPVIFLSPFLLAQNLVANGDFEFCIPDTSGLSLINIAPPWESAGKGTPDYKRGAEGRFAGLYFCSIQENNREYITAPLLSPLQSCKTYRVQLRARLSVQSQLSVNCFGIYFSKEKIFRDNRLVIPAKPQVNFSSEDLHVKDGIWITFTDTFRVGGEEKYIVIGNFNGDENSDIRTFKKFAPLKYAYYELDDIILSEIPALSNCPADTPRPIVKIAEDTFKTGQIITLQNIYFETNSDMLLPASYDELNNLFELLLSNPDIQIQINGHTDNEGKAELNQKLSEERAKAVVNYLSGKGISPQRLASKGFGMSQPVDTNETAEGRMKNRRVEFMILKK